MDQALVNTLVLGLVIFVIVFIALLYVVFQRQGNEFAKEYYRKFLGPKRERGLALGISDERLHELWKEALDSTTDPTVLPPGMIFDQLINREIDNQND